MADKVLIYLLKVKLAGVIPIIFAMSIMSYFLLL